MNTSYPKLSRSFFLFLFLTLWSFSFSQSLYTARGYWEESTKPIYLSVKKKQNSGDSLSTTERLYLQDHESYLATYYEQLADEEKKKYQRMKYEWQLEASGQKPIVEEPSFDWGRKNRLANAVFGAYYGISFVQLTKDKLNLSSAARVSIPLITSGLWMLGPAINPNRYEGATLATIRSTNTGRLLGLGYGAALAQAIKGGSDDAGKWALGLSSVSSIAMGEIGFHFQKKNNLSLGHINLMRHYSILAAWSTASVTTATGVAFEDDKWIGASLFAGGVSGIFIGNRMAKKYNYTSGDVDAITTLSLIGTGLGLTGVFETINNNNSSSALILIPAATSIAGTLIGQKQVRNANFTNLQGRAVSAASVGAALIGLGIVFATEQKSPAAYIGVPSGLALVAHQIFLHRFKRNNIERGLQGNAERKFGYHLSFNITPENYFINKKMTGDPRSFQEGSMSMQLQNPLATLRVRF
jgi:hypothetical protein